MDKKSRDLVMAKLYYKNKDFKMAEKCIDEYLSINPEDVSALKIQAQIYEQQKRYDKAFDMYERCFLIEPDRTGVLLDICRILQVDYLEQVDYRKWLQLASKAFPSNPIVTNLGFFLSNMPQKGPLKDEAPSSDILIKILEKLTTMEAKIEGIEKKLEQKSTNEKESNQIKDSQPNSQSIFKPSTFSFDQPSIFGKTETKNETPTTTSIFGRSFLSPGGSKPTGDLFSESMNRMNISKETPVKTQINNSPGLFKPVEKPSEAGNNGDQKDKVPKDLSIQQTSTTFSFDQPSIFGKTETKNETTTTGIFGGSFLPPASSKPTGNLFFESMNRLNIPKDTPVKTQTNNSFGLFKPVDIEKPSESANDGDENDKVPNEDLAIEQTCTMEPVEIKTGEEDEDVLFEYRCKLFRLRDKEYKERGLGSIKVLKHRNTGKGRLIMRRDAIGLVCLNCFDCSKIERVRENQIRWLGLDASDGQPEPNVFLVKFKTSEITDEFMSHLENLFPDGLNTSNSQILTPQPKVDKIQNLTGRTKQNDDQEIQLVEPKLDPALVDKAQKLMLPDLFYHDLTYRDPHANTGGGEED